MNYLLIAMMVLMATTWCKGGNTNNNQKFQLQIEKIEAEVKLDGILDEGFWSQIQESSAFINKWPQDTGLAKAQTKVKLAYDANFL